MVHTTHRSNPPAICHLSSATFSLPWQGLDNDLAAACKRLSEATLLPSPLFPLLPSVLLQKYLAMAYKSPSEATLLLSPLCPLLPSVQPLAPASQDPETKTAKETRQSENPHLRRLHECAAAQHGKAARFTQKTSPTHSTY